MTDHDALRMRFRIANPVPDPDAVDANELDRILLGIESQWDEVRGLASPSKTPDRIRRSRLAPVLVFAAAALLILLAVGLPMLLMGGNAEIPPVEEPTTVPTTTAMTIPVTTVPVTVPAGPSTTTSEAPQAAPAPTMMWERVPHQPIFEDAGIFDVVEGGPGLVAVGALGDWNVFGTPSLAEGGAQGVVFMSSDGYEWERVDSPAYVADTFTAIWSVAVGPNGLLVAAGHYGYDRVHYLSSDGLTWERLAPGGFTGSVYGSDSGFIGFGEVPRAGGVGSDAGIWLSTDGREWTRIEDDAFLATEEDDWSVGIVDVAEGGPGIVAIGHAGLSGGMSGLPGVDRMAVWLSADGTDWERLSDLEDTWAATISKDPETERLVISGMDMWTSMDGYTWVQSEMGDPQNQPRQAANLAWDGDRVVAGGPDANVSLWVSGDRGDTWSRIGPNDPIFDGYRPVIRSLTRFGDVFVAVGEAGDYLAEVAAVWIGALDE